MNHETKDQTRLRRAKEAVAACRDTEDTARKALAAAVESTKLAREKYTKLFRAAEKLEVDRLRAAFHNPCYYK